MAGLTWDIAVGENPGRMTGIGCLIMIGLLAGLWACGVITAVRHNSPVWLGGVWGMVAWLATILAYMCGLTVFDWWDSFRHPKREGVPGWVIALIWLFFVATAAATVMLYRHVAGA